MPNRHLDRRELNKPWIDFNLLPLNVCLFSGNCKLDCACFMFGYCFVFDSFLFFWEAKYGIQCNNVLCFRRPVANFKHFNSFWHLFSTLMLSVSLPCSFYFFAFIARIASHRIASHWHRFGQRLLNMGNKKR